MVVSLWVFSLHNLKAYINNASTIYMLKALKNIEGSVVFKDILMHHKCEHVTSFLPDKR